MKTPCVGRSLLTVILSCASLAQDALDQPSALLDYLGNIVDASERAAALTGQLLMFTRRDQSSAQTFDVRDEVTLSVRLIERVVGERIAVRVEDSAEPCWVKMDRGHLHQVLVNLAVNARDAMPHGGRLNVSTRRLADTSTVRIALSDTGVGMDTHTLHHAFEPFFTTKPAHKGTGLGLSTCHDIITSAGGTIVIESAPASGTTITIDLPLESQPPALEAKPKRGSRPNGMRRRVLLVEDEQAVRLLATQSLRDAGFEVSGVANAEQAMELFESRGFDLLVSDVILPGKSGTELARLARDRLPRLKVLLVTGYAGEANVEHEQILVKPYTPDGLLTAIDRLLS